MGKATEITAKSQKSNPILPKKSDCARNFDKTSPKTRGVGCFLDMSDCTKNVFLFSCRLFKFKNIICYSNTKTIACQCIIFPSKNQFSTFLCKKARFSNENTRRSAFLRSYGLPADDVKAERIRRIRKGRAALRQAKRATVGMRDEIAAFGFLDGDGLVL